MYHSFLLLVWQCYVASLSVITLKIFVSNYTDFPIYFIMQALKLVTG